MNVLDYSKVQKRVLPVTLRDGTALSLEMPKKRVFTKLLQASKTLSSLSDSEETINEIFGVAAEILSSNTQRKEISAEYVAENLDFDDVSVLLNAYMSFVGLLKNDPN